MAYDKIELNTVKFDCYCTEHYCKYHEEFEPIKQGGQW